MKSETDVIGLDGSRRSVASERERLKLEMFEHVIHSDSDETWQTIAERLAPRRGHLRKVDA